MARPVTVFSDSAAVVLADRLPAVDSASAVPTQMMSTMKARPPATSPRLILRLVRSASQRCAKSPKIIVAATTTITGAGMAADSVVSASTCAEVCS